MAIWSDNADIVQPKMEKLEDICKKKFTLFSGIIIDGVSIIILRFMYMYICNLGKLSKIPILPNLNYKYHYKFMRYSGFEH